jgi:hypothetical protein
LETLYILQMKIQFEAAGVTAATPRVASIGIYGRTRNSLAFHIPFSHLLPVQFDPVSGCLLSSMPRDSIIDPFVVPLLSYEESEDEYCSDEQPGSVWPLADKHDAEQYADLEKEAKCY